MDLKRTAIIAFIGIFSFFRTTEAQFEDLEGCLTGEFVPLLADCMVQSIIGDIDVGNQFFSYDIESSNTAGRKLQSVDTDYKLSSNARRNYVNMKLEKAGIKQNSIFEDLKKLGRMWSLGMREEAVSEKLKSLNLKETIGEHYMMILKEHLGEVIAIISKLRYFEASTKQSGTNAFEQPEIGQSRQDIQICLDRFTEADFEDNLDWLQCLISCDGLGPLWTCTTEAMEASEAPCSNVVWFADSVIALVANFLNKSSCDFVIDEPEYNSTMELTEGGEEKYVNFRTYLPPGVLCIGPDPINDPIQLGLSVVGNVFGFNVTCDVEMQLTTANWLDDAMPYIARDPDRFRPKCRVPNRSLRQVAIGFHDAAVNNSGIFKITNQNWNETFEIPLLAVVDHRVDGDVDVSFTMKMYVQEVMRGNTVKRNVRVIDTDVTTTGITGQVGAVECYSINDPHIMTFDGHYYNNFYQGAFYLYKHDEFPYEVQTIYQPCERGNNNGTCNCAVAVRSGDDVFVMDRCRRCVDGVCDVTQLTVLYTRGEITPGTQIFKMNDGLRHDVVLPHGTIVRIIASNDLLNVWIMPGSYDYKNTTGLCGTFNEDSLDDLTMPNGTVYSGPGNGNAEQPHGFNQAWRVPEEDLIFYGSKELNEPFRPTETCTCTHILMSGAECGCGRGTATEICDLFLENPYTPENIASIIYPSLNNGSIPSYLTDIDLDETYVPHDLTDWTGSWDEITAEEFCRDLIENSTNPIIQRCILSPLIKVPALEFCMQDIQILDNTNWQSAVTDNVMYRCYNEMVRSLSWNNLMLFPNSSCINQCRDNGICNEGICMCNEGFYGPDCQPMTDSDPYLIGKDTQLCDTRHQMCHFATVFGYNFPGDGSMLCQIKNIEISPDGVDYLPVRYTQTWERAMVVINSNQAVCPLPMNGSFEVYTVWDEQQSSAISMWNSILPQSLLGESHHRMKRHTGVNRMEVPTGESVEVKFIYIAYDSACYACEATTQSCVKKMTTDHCWINSTCWAPGETKPNDPCRSCSPSDNMNDWTMSEATQECIDQAAEEEKEAEDKKKDMIMRGAIGGSVSLLVIIVVIIMFCVSRKKEKKAQEAAKEHLNITVEPKKGTVYYEEGHKGYENHALAKDDDDGYAIRHNSFGGSSIGGPQRIAKTRVDMLKSEEITRPVVENTDNSLETTTLRTSL